MPPEGEAAPQAPEPEVQDTPQEQEAAPEGTPASDEQVNYEQRYNDLRPEFDRATQEREQKSQEALAWQILASSDDQDQRQAAAEYLDVELDDQEQPDDEDEYEDPNDDRLNKLEQAMQAQQEAESQKAFDNHLDELASGAEVKLNKHDRRVLQAISEENGFSPEATEEAFKGYLEEREAYEKGVIDTYVQGKRKAPARPPSGSNATEQPDLDDRQARQAWMTERYQIGRQ